MNKLTEIPFASRATDKSPVNADLSSEVVIILGIDNPTGLCLCREFGEKGATVIGLYSARFSIGGASRYVAATYRRAPKEQLIDQLLRLSTTHHARALLAVAENDIQWINQHRALFSGVEMLFPEQKIMDGVLDKAETYKRAKALGINVPETYEIYQLSELELLKPKLSFPAVIKWKEPVAMLARLSELGLPLIKAEYIYSYQQLYNEMSHYEAVGEFPMIQEYQAGVGLGQFILMHEGQAIQRFQHQRVHEWPPEGGYSTLCRSLPLSEHQALFSQSEALLKSLNWNGVAMVEYRYDPKLRRAVLMEINGRFWGSYPLAYHSGTGFGWRLYQAQVHHRVLPESELIGGLECRFMVPETKRLMRVLFSPGSIKDKAYRNTPLLDFLCYLAGFFTPSARYFVFMFRDSRPFFTDVKGVLFNIVTKVLRR